MKEIIVYHHLGLGDHFICNGLVNFLSENVDKLYLVCKEHNFETISCLYKENDSVEILKIKKEPQDIELFARVNNIRILQIGFKDFNNPTFDVSFYSQLNLDFSLRYSKFKLPNYIQNSQNLYNTLVTKMPYCLISQSCSDKDFDLQIDTDLHKIYIHKGLTDNLLDYVKIIQNASEIHCIDSSLYHLIDSMEVSGKLYFHDVRGTENNKIRVSDKWIKV